MMEIDYLKRDLIECDLKKKSKEFFLIPVIRPFHNFLQ